MRRDWDGEWECRGGAAACGDGGRGVRRTRPGLLQKVVVLVVTVTHEFGRGAAAPVADQLRAGTPEHDHGGIHRAGRKRDVHESKSQ